VLAYFLIHGRVFGMGVAPGGSKVCETGSQGLRGEPRLRVLWDLHPSGDAMLYVARPPLQLAEGLRPTRSQVTAPGIVSVRRLPTGVI